MLPKLLAAFFGLLLTAALAMPAQAEAVRECAGPFTATIQGFTFNYLFCEVQTPSGNADAELHGTLVSAPPAEAVRIETPCFTTYGVTTAEIEITPSGRVNITCHFSP